MTSAFRSKKEIVYHLIRDSILRGEHKPGTRLVIDDLVTKLNVSQIPIREAMRQLEADGFVTIEPYVGATVTRIDARFIYEVFALLESLEVVSSRAACEQITDADLQALKALIEKMDSSMDNPVLWSQQNRELHIFIARCAKMDLTTKMLDKVFDHWERLRLHYLKGADDDRRRTSQEEHHKILNVISTRDPDAVERVVREHNQNALASYKKLLQSAGHLEAS